MEATILDYGVGNLFSLSSGLRAAGIAVQVEQDVQRASEAECLVLPGVGAFPVAASRLAETRLMLRDRLEHGLPCLAICLGMQLLFERSAEGPGAGVGLFAGEVTALRASRVPHIGWNAVESEDPMFGASQLRTAYFANGFACRPAADTTVIAWTEHEGDRFPAAIRLRRTVGVQFHPEKSSGPGLRFLEAFWRSTVS
jgi:glutamine amidotransferase